MSLNGVSVVSSNQDVTSKKASSKSTSNASSSNASTSNQNTNTKDVSANEVSAVYEKSSDTGSKKVTYKPDTETINQMKADADRRTSELRSLVEKMLLKQGQTIDESEMYSLLREGKVQVDPETAAKAKADIAEDGYWGVAQTSDRLLSFAKALTGGDPSKAEEMIAAVKKGFEEATKTWGGELPDLCKQTLDATIKKLDDWKNSLNGDSSSETSE